MTDSPIVVERTETMTVECHGRLSEMYALSPFVWRSGGRYELMLRAVPRRDDTPALKIAEAWWGWSDDGRHFTMDRAPALWPSHDGPDRDGCEDPTVVPDGDTLHVWYSGWHEGEETGRLLHAFGPAPDRLVKRGVALDDAPDFANPKEATVRRGPDGWALAFEFARDGSSMVGVARAERPEGPWTDRRDLLLPCPGRWDDRHTSAGPIVSDPDGRPLMFYNGATDGPRWRIGWARLSADLSTVEERGEEFLIAPECVTGDATDIAFAASAVAEGDRLALYYSVSDRHLMRATLRWR